MFNFIKKCPKCNKRPIIKYEYTSLYEDTGYGDFYYGIKCCSFNESFSKKSNTIYWWNKKIKQYKKERKTMKLEILNENVKQDKDKIVFKLIEESTDNIKLVFKKNQANEWETLLTIFQNGSLCFNTRELNKHFLNKED